jgi:hypothetical protein
MAPRWPKLTPRWPNMDYDGFMMASRCPRIGHWGHLESPWGFLGANSGPTWRHFGPTCFKLHLTGKTLNFPLVFIGFEVSTGPSWGHVGAILDRLGALLGQLGAILSPLGSTWGPFGPYPAFWVSTPIGNTIFSGVGTPVGGHLGPSWGHFGCQDGP